MRRKEIFSFFLLNQKMISLKSLCKWPHGWYSFQILLLLTVPLVTLYLIQMSHLHTVAKMKYEKEKEINNLFETEEFPFFKNSIKKVFQGEKLIHLDLKGAPPKIAYLLNFITFIKRLGATGILIEYEDMFPYHNGLEDIKALNAYTLSDIAAIVQTAEINNLTIIPLVQTFSHFEFVLKLEQYREFREVESNPQILCPCQKNVHFILKKMIDQVLKAHRMSKYLHIGSDEPQFLGVCSKCQKLLMEKKWQKDNIYFNHVKLIAEYIVENHPGVRPIMWGDKFIKKNEKIILSHRIPDLVEVMLWNYRPTRNSFPPKEDMDILTKLFKNIWIANAFKGATGSRQIVTNIEYHLKNSRGWTEFVDEWKTMINFKGIALTGWQRYNHFMVLCELLPVGIPSLALNLQYLNAKEVFDYEEVKQSLNCSGVVPVNLREIEDLLLLSTLKCDFPGFKVYHVIHSFYNALLHSIPSLAKLENVDFSFYNILHNSSNPSYVHELNLESYKKYLLELNDLENEIRVAMEEVYDQNTINEWIMTHVLPVQMRLEAAINIINSLSSRNAWPRRPFVNTNVKAKNFFNKICTKNETMGCAFLNIH